MNLQQIYSDNYLPYFSRIARVCGIYYEKHFGLFFASHQYFNFTIAALYGQQTCVSSENVFCSRTCNAFLTCYFLAFCVGAV